MHRSAPAASLALLLTVAMCARAQTGVPTASVGTALDSVQRAVAAPLPRPVNDSLFRRARRMVGEGNGPAGRALVDSLVRVAAPGTPAYGDALYWHGALAATASEAERDYRRVIVEYPLAYYADDALLAIAELEQARGDRAGALAHLQRYVRSRPVSPERGIAALGAARLAFEQRDTRTGCAMLSEARASIGTADVELHNQVEYYAGRCPDGSIATAAPVAPAPVAPVARETAAAAASTAASTPAPAPAVPRATPSTRATTTTATSTGTAKSGTENTGTKTTGSKTADTKTAGAKTTSTMKTPSAYTPPRAAKPAAMTRPVPRVERYTVQLAAYNTRPDAERLVEKLGSRGVKARVSGSAKPFRVRLDFYRTEREAAAVVTSLKARGIVGFVTTEVPPPAASTP